MLAEKRQKVLFKTTPTSRYPVTLTLIPSNTGNKPL